MLYSTRQNTNHVQGFTLIEILIGLSVLALAVVLLSTLLFPQAERSANAVLQSRAATLAQAFLNEISSHSFDENSDRSGTGLRCGESGAANCSTVLGPDSETRDRFDDVDDYHQLHLATPNLEDALGSPLDEDYNDFSYRIEVCYSDVSASCVAGVSRFKRVTVVINTGQDQAFTFSTLSGNY